MATTGEPGSLREQPLRHGGRFRWTAILQITGLFACFTLVAAPLTLLQLDRGYPLSPVDELTYADFLFKVDGGQYIIHRGEPLGGQSLHEAACRGGPLDHLQPNPSLCAQPYLPPHERNTADIDPPTYYVLTDLGARAVRAAGLTSNLVTAGRMVGLCWAGLGLLAVYLLARAVGASLTSSLIAVEIVAVSPLMIDQWRYLTPHALDLPVGGAATLLVLAWDRQRAGIWALLLAGAIPPLVKAPQVIVVGLLALFLLLGILRRDGFGARPALDRRRIVGLMVLIGSLAAGTIIWLAVRHHFALSSPPPVTAYDVKSLPWQSILSNIGAFLMPWSGGAGLVPAVLIVGWCYGSAAAAAVSSSVTERRRLGLALLVMATFGAMVFVFSNYLLVHQYAPIPSRYGYTLAPAALAIGALALRTVIAQLAVACVGAALAAVIILQL